jgi:hypothetical protein
MGLLGLAAANALIALVGAGGLMLTGTWDRLAPASRIAPALLAGFAIAVACLGPLVYIGLTPTPLAVAALGVLLLAAGLWRRGIGSRSLRRDRRSGGGLAVAAVGLMASSPLIYRAATEPLIKFDAYADWSLKAKLLYGHGGWLLGAFDVGSLTGLYTASHREYPIGMPAIEAFDFHVMGSADAQLIHLQFLVLLGAFAGTIWSLLRPRVSAALLAAVLFLLFVAPGLHTQLLAAYADVPIACLWAAAALATGLWLLGDGDDLLWLAALLGAGALALKQEGVVLETALFVVAAFTAAFVRPRDLRKLGIAALGVVASAVPWQVWVRHHDLRDADIAPSIRRMLDQADTLPTIVRRLGVEMIWTKWPGVVVLAVIVAGALAVRQRDWLAASYLALLSLASTGLVAVYWNARTPVNGLLTQSAERVVTAPILLSVALLPLLITRLGSSGAAPAVAHDRAGPPPIEDKP